MKKNKKVQKLNLDMQVVRDLSNVIGAGACSSANSGMGTCNSGCTTCEKTK
jgi:hypothetical protein